MTETKKDTPVVSEPQMGKEWEELVSSGLVAREGGDKSQWVLGDLALKVTTVYGQDSLGKYAIAINVNKNTLRRYRLVSKVFTPENRFEVLSHRHHQLVAGREDRLELLEMADSNGMSIEALQMYLKKMEMDLSQKVKLTHIAVTKEQLERIIKWGSKFVTLDTDKTPEDEEVLEKLKQRLIKVEAIPDAILNPVK